MRVLRYRLNKIKQHCKRIVRLHTSADNFVPDDFSASSFHPYEFRDREIIDYDIRELKHEGWSFKVRGPLPEKFAKGQYGVCIGAAQTFGCYVEKPFPEMLAEKIGFPMLNLGKDGASPKTFSQDENLMNYINNAKFVVLQIMAARGYGNSLVKMAATQRTVINRADNQELDAFDFYQKLFSRHDPDEVKKVVDETRENWIQDTKKLLSLIKVPTVLLWFSQRKPAYLERYHRISQLLEAIKNPLQPEKFTQVGQLFGAYPQLINQGMIEQIKPLATHYIECATSRGWPQMLYSKIKGERPMIYENGKKFERRFNGYPSPEMHEDAAKVLSPLCKQFINSSNQNG
jgi:hypothetical protein